MTSKVIMTARRTESRACMLIRIVSWVTELKLEFEVKWVRWVGGDA